jgi:hypothetical protein
MRTSPVKVLHVMERRDWTGQIAMGLLTIKLEFWLSLKINEQPSLMVLYCT